MAEFVAAAPFLQGCKLPHAWRGHTAWRVLDTRFAHGLRFLQTWHEWNLDPQRARILRYVALAETLSEIDEMLARASPFPALFELAQELAPQWYGLLPGFHSLTLGDGKVLLTLCIGDTRKLLHEQCFLADSVFLDLVPQGHPLWDAWHLKALARCCHRGTTLSGNADTPEWKNQLAQCGFQFAALTQASGSPILVAKFEPTWKIRRTRRSLPMPAATPGHCAVIGAGLAGASVASALAHRGWTVTVLDQHDAPAGGASGLPAGLVFPHVSADDCVLSRLSRSGVRLMLHQAHQLLRQGWGWAPSGVLEHRLGGLSGVPPNWPACGQQWSQAAQGSSQAHPAIWHVQGAWLKPAALVRAWLAQPGITFRGGSTVGAVEPARGQWSVLDPHGEQLVQVDRVVFANACGAAPLVEALASKYPSEKVLANQLPAMSGMRGQLSWATHLPLLDDFFPPTPVNGSGSVMAFVPADSASVALPAWYVGSTYQNVNEPELPEAANHADNLAHLERLLPTLAQILAPQFSDGSVQAWKGTRCVTSDRLPLVGPLQAGDHPTLWICAGMGSRGLTFSALCAELLAAQWGSEPLPVPARLARSLTPLRRGGTVADA